MSSSGAWLSEKEKKEMLAFALSDDVREDDVQVLQESLMRHLHLSTTNDDEDDGGDDEKYVDNVIEKNVVKKRDETTRKVKKFSITLEEARENFHQDVSSEWQEETKKFDDERLGETNFQEPITVEPVDVKDWSSAERHRNHSPSRKQKKASLVVIAGKKDKEKTMSPLDILRSFAKETPLLDLNSDTTCSTAYSFFDISRRNRSRERLVDYVGKKVRNDRYHRERNEMLLERLNSSSDSNSMPRRVALSDDYERRQKHHESARTRLVRMDHTLGHAVPHVTTEYDERAREKRPSTVPPGNIDGKKTETRRKVKEDSSSPDRVVVDRMSIKKVSSQSPPGDTSRVSLSAGPPGQINRMSVTTAAYMNNSTGSGRNNTVTKSPASLRASMFTLSSELPSSTPDFPSSPPGSISSSPLTIKTTTTTPSKIVDDEEEATHVELPDASPLMMMDIMRPSIAASFDETSITAGTSHRVQKTDEVDVTLADDEMSMPPGQIRQMSVATKAYMDKGEAKDLRGSVIKPPSSVRASMFTPGLTSPEDLNADSPPGNL